MRRNWIIPALCILAMQAPARATDEEPLQKVLNEIDGLRRFAEKEAQARADETLALKRSLEEARKEIASLDEQATEMKIKLATARVESEAAQKLCQILEKLLADQADKREVRVAALEVPENRPAHDVRGKITSIADAGLLVVNLGADDGLKQSHVLEVFRQGKFPQPLGSLTVMRVYGKQSVGQFKPAGADRAEVGDEVGNRLFGR